MGGYGEVRITPARNRQPHLTILSIPSIYSPHFIHFFSSMNPIQAMSSFDDFVHIPFDPSIEPQYSTSSNQEAESSFLSTNGSIITKRYLQNARGPRICTEIALTSSIRSAFPKHFLTVTPVYNCDLIAFADTRDDTSYSAHGDPNKTFLQERLFIPPARRYNDETGGQFVDRLLFGRFDYTFQGHKFIVYIAEGGDGVYGKPTYNYILVAPKEHGQEMSVEEKVEAQQKTDNLIRETRKWAEELHDEVLIFDAVWQKNKDLWKNVQKSKWEDVILEKEKKEVSVHFSQVDFVISVGLEEASVSLRVANSLNVKL